MNYKKLYNLTLLGGALAIAGGEAQSVELSVPQLRLPVSQNAPTVDGVIHEEEWRDAARMERFGRPAPLSPQAASFWVASNGKELFIAVRSETPPGGKLLARVNPQPGSVDAAPFSDDSVEIFIDPARESGAPDRTTYQLITNAKGAILDQSFVLNGSGKEWRGKWRIANSVKDDRWDCEIAIPWSDLGINTPITGRAMGIRIGRNWQQSIGVVQTEWSPLGGSYGATSTMPMVTWDNGAPIVQVLQLQGAPGQAADIQLSLRNPGTTPLKVLTTLDVVPQNSQSTHSSQTIDLAAGEAKTVVVKPVALAHETLFTQLQVASPDGKTTYYQRNFQWQIDRPEIVWNLNTDAVKRIDTQFAYYPSYHQMKVRVNLEKLENRGAVREVNLAVRRKGETKPLAETTLPPLKEGITELPIWNLPQVGEGEYELVVKLAGIQAEPQVLPFVRQKFVWEGNQLGRSDIVVKPFTPLEVKGNRVGVIMRQHTMNGIGLWDQVTALDKPLLKSPMRLEATIGGKIVTATGALKINEKQPTHVAAQANWSAGALKGTTRSEWDYDGLMKSTFTLQPTTQTVDSLTLVVPLDDKSMPLLHATSTGLRFNFAGSTPTGQGKIWDSTEGRRSMTAGNYMPYIWLGAQERGFSVFGENDKGWITDTEVPCQEIVRNANGSLELRLHLIAKPTRLDTAREITLGFQATPIKPLPENWRLWTVGSRGKERTKGQLHQAFYGSGRYRGTVISYSELYPRDEDFSIYEKLAETRRTGKVDQAFIEKWLAGNTKSIGNPSVPPDEANIKSYRAHIQAGFQYVQPQPENVLVYTNARGVRLDVPEGQTFLDEWHNAAYPPRHWDYGGAVDFNLDPVASYRDYAMYYYKKMFDTFVDNIYFDDVFLASNFDTVGTAAYELPDGRVQPAMGLWDMRELVRRSSVFLQESGKPQANMAHMTNTAIAPILAFADTNLAWEDRAGDSDFQDRFRRDAIQAESLGRQFGNVPFVLTLIEGPDKAKTDWAARTAAGVMLTHELKPVPAAKGVADFWTNYDRLVAFGYGQPNVKVSNYWQADYPLQVSGGETSSLLISKPGQALIIVCDWGVGGDLQLKLDAAALGLRGPLTVKDHETGEALLLNAAGNIQVAIKKHDFKIISVQAQ